MARDEERRIYTALWQRFSGPVRTLMENRFVFNPFWQHNNGIDGFEDWEERVRTSSRSFAQAFQAGDNVRVLSFVFDRLYVLRNQLVHGGSTWNSGVNRAQVGDGAAILAFLLPVFVDLMMDNPKEDWDDRSTRWPTRGFTAHAMVHQVVEYITAGFDTHLAKPFHAEDLVRTISE